MATHERQIETPVGTQVGRILGSELPTQFAAEMQLKNNVFELPILNIWGSSRAGISVGSHGRAETRARSREGPAVAGAETREPGWPREQSLHAGFISELMSAEPEWFLPLAY